MLSAPVATIQLPVTVSFDYVSIGVYTPTGKVYLTNNTTPVTIIDAPATGTQRRLASLELPNIDTAPATVIIQTSVAGVVEIAVVITLSVGDILFYGDGQFYVLDKTGSKKNIGSGDGSISYAETPAGVIDGENTVFTLTEAATNPNAVIALLDGVSQYVGIDYTVSGNAIRFFEAPAEGSTIFVYYNVLVDGFSIVDETIDGGTFY